jgi:hypothetical protein
MIRRLEEAVFRIEAERVRLAGDGPLPRVSDLDVGLMESGTGALIFYELNDCDWYAAGFEWPDGWRLPDPEADSDANAALSRFIEAEAVRLLQDLRYVVN